MRGRRPEEEHVDVAAVVGHEDGGFARSAAFSEPYFDAHHAQKYGLADILKAMAPGHREPDCLENQKAEDQIQQNKEH